MVDILLSIGVAVLVTTPITIGIPLLRYWLWLRRFKQENCIAAAKFYAECRVDDEKWEAENQKWLKDWESTITNG